MWGIPAARAASRTDKRPFRHASRACVKPSGSGFFDAPNFTPSAHPLFHSDRGYQYTNRQFKAKLDGIHATQSMSRPGRCIDNGPMEGFWGIRKSEMYYLQQFHTFEELKKAIDEYMDFYNTRRLQAKLKGLAPLAYRNQTLVA